jgi:hypothetical protein
VNIPIINNILPSAAGLSSQSSVNIYGSGFQYATDISFGNVNISYNNGSGFTINSDSRITVTSPIYTASGIINIAVKTTNGTSDTNVKTQFMYYDNSVYNALPVISSLTPTNGAITGHTNIVIDGSGFSPTGLTPTIHFGESQVTTITTFSNNRISCLVPQGTLSINSYQANVNVTTVNGTSINNIHSIFTYNAGNPTTTNIDNSYNGIVYAIYGKGGFQIEQGFPKILLGAETPISQYDVTNALQLKYDVRLINKKLGIIKNYNNTQVLDSSLNTTNNTFPIDSITITSTEFVANMTANQVISVGTYYSLYSNFNEFVSTYFSYPVGFSTLFSNEYNNTTVFDANAFIHIINGYSVTPQGDYIKDLSGSVTIGNINSVLRYIVDSNIFGNRHPSTGTTASATNHSNYGMNDGFVAGDLIMIPAGTTITLQLDIEPEISYPINNIGPQNVQTYPNGHPINTTMNYSNVNNNTLFTQKTVSTTTNITTVLTAPLLLVLDNLSTQ